MTNYQQLISQVSQLARHYREMDRLSGGNFNIFRVINVSSDELKHSLFIADLLNPKGSHGQGAVFLKLFVEQLGITPFVVDDTVIEIEKGIGKVTEDEGGRLDIYLNDCKGNKVVIENKIYADDQPNQLIRYYQFHRQHVYYLTLDGRDASPYSTHNGSYALKSGEHYKTISYQSDIIDWLEQCRKEVTQLPLLREGISHYINLIKYLTGESTNKAMRDEIIEIATLNEQSLRGVAVISNNFSAVKAKVQWDFWKALRENLESKGVKFEDNPKNTVSSTRTSNYYHGRAVHYGLWYELTNFDGITVHWGCEIQENIYFGFTIERNGDGGISDNEEFKPLRELIKECNINYQTTKNWIGWRHTSPMLNFKTFNTDVIFSLINKTKLDEIVEGIAQEAMRDIEFVRERLPK